MKVKTLSSLIIAGLLVTPITTVSTFASTDTNAKTNTEQTTKSSNTVALKDIKTTPEKAIEIAQNEYKGDVKEVAFEKEHGEWSYKIAQVHNTDESEVTIKDKDQKVANKEKEADEEHQSDKTFNYKQDVKPYTQALQKGIDEVNGGSLKEWSIEKDHGKLVYDMDILYKGDNHEVSIDAKSLKILKNEIDN
jgi:uncharacterized membrane protein YkoI